MLLDATLWDEPTTGIGLYTRCLYQALVARGVAVSRVGARRSGEHPRGEQGRTAFALGSLPALLAQVPGDVFHAVGNFNLPLQRVAGKKLVLTVHDLIPELFPDTVSVGFRWQFKLWLQRSLQVADRVICVSERTRQDLARRYPAHADKLRVVLHGVDHVDAGAPLDAISEAYLASLGLPERYVLYAGALDKRKNVGAVLEAIDALWRGGERVPLLLVGQRWFGSGPVERRVRQMQSAGIDVRPLGYQPEPLFYAFMRRASVFVFPSRYEGFGLPPLEAMRLGVPVVASNAGALPEVCADAALLVPPDDTAGLAEALRRLWVSPDERQRLVAAGARRAAQLTWAKTAEATEAVYAEALR